MPKRTKNGSIGELEALNIPWSFSEPFPSSFRHFNFLIQKAFCSNRVATALLSWRWELSALVLVACNGSLISEAQQFLQHVWIASCLQVPHGKGFAEQGWAEMLARDSGPFP